MSLLSNSQQEPLYYIIYNGQQYGPMPKEEMIQYGLSQNSSVWTDGMGSWTTASRVPELAQFIPTAQRLDIDPEMMSPHYRPTYAQGDKRPNTPGVVGIILIMVSFVMRLLSSYSYSLLVMFCWCLGLVLSVIGAMWPKHERRLGVIGVILALLTVAIIFAYDFLIK